MAITIKFTASSAANGLKAFGFERSNAGVGLFFDFREEVTVSNDRATFTSISIPGEFAFSLVSPTGTRWRSGPLREIPPPTPTYTFWVLDVGILTFSPARLAGMLSPLPPPSGSMTITSAVLSVGTGNMTVTGTGTYGTIFGAIPITYTYVFTLDVVGEPANMGMPGGISPAIDVRTISLTVSGAAGGFLGFLVNFFIGVLYALVSNSVRYGIELSVQRSIDAEVATALAAQSAPAGTIATVETLTINPTTGVSLNAFAGIRMEKLCASNPGGGSITVRPPEHLARLRAIRDRLLTRSPQGIAYIELFEKFNSELVQLLLSDEELLHAFDAIVLGILREFPMECPGTGRLSKDLADSITCAMSMVEKLASKELALSIASVKKEVSSFVDRPAQDVLDESFNLLGGVSLDDRDCAP